MGCSMPGFLILHHRTELAQTHVHWVSDAIQPSHPLSSPSPPAFNPSQHQGLFQWVSSLHELAKVFSFSISPSNEYSGLISFRIDWFDLLAVQGTLKSLLQYHSLKGLRISRGKMRFLDSNPPNHTHTHTHTAATMVILKQSTFTLFFYPNFKSRNRFCFFKWERQKHLCSSSELTWGWSWLEQEGLWVRSNFESPLGCVWLCRSL